MGAAWFLEIGKGLTAKEVFNTLKEQALYDHGHGGYTGSIAEKSSFKVVPIPEGMNPRGGRFESEATAFLENNPELDDKWGPAVCFDLGDGEYAFFGWASS